MKNVFQSSFNAAALRQRVADVLDAYWAHLRRYFDTWQWLWHGAERASDAAIGFLKSVAAWLAQAPAAALKDLRWCGDAWGLLRQAVSRLCETFWNLVKRLACWIYRWARWWVSVFVSAVLHFDRHDCAMRAAAISYFGLISFFPLVLVLIIVISYFLEVPVAQKQVLDIILTSAPTAGDLVRGNMEQILRYRNTVGLVAVAGFFWSASAVFSTIDLALNRIWDVEVLRSYWRSKLLAILVVIAIGGLSMASMLTTASVNLFRGVLLPFLSSQFDVSLGPWRMVVLSIPYLTNFLLFMFVYGVFPHTRVNWLHIWPGALLAAIVWEQAKTLFTDYLATFGSYNLVYGSVGTIIALMVWFYLSASILLMGAEISAAYSQAVRRQRELS